MIKDERLKMMMNDDDDMTTATLQATSEQLRRHSSQRERELVQASSRASPAPLRHGYMNMPLPLPLPLPFFPISNLHTLKDGVSQLFFLVVFRYNFEAEMTCTWEWGGNHVPEASG